MCMICRWICVSIGVLVVACDGGKAGGPADTALDAGQGMDSQVGRDDGQGAEMPRQPPTPDAGAVDARVLPEGRWTNFTPSPLPASWPLGQEGFGMAFDSKRARLVVYGGVGGCKRSGGLCDELWEYAVSSGSWERRERKTADALWPPGLVSAAMVYDPDKGRELLVGGLKGVPGGPSGDLWIWDGEAGLWEKASGGIPAREDLAAAYDTHRQRLVVFGGMVTSTMVAFMETSLADLWEWDGQNWAEIPHEGEWPASRTGHAMTFDSARSRVIMFGGLTLSPEVGGVYRSDMWAWDGAVRRWEFLGDEFGGKDWPRARGATAIVYNEKRDTLLAYAGKYAAGGSQIEVLSDTWGWSPESGWHQYQDQGIGPGKRQNHKTVFDTLRGVVLLYGGGPGALVAPSQKELWEWGD